MIIWIFVLLFAYLFFYSRHRLRYFASHGVPTMPPAPFFGNLTAVTFGRENFVDAMGAGYDKFKEYRYFGLYQYLIPTLIPRDPELIREIFVRDFTSFADRGVHVRPDCDDLFGRNLIMLQGSEWRTMRTAITPAFSSARCRAMTPLMIDRADMVIKHLKDRITQPQVFDVNEFTLAYSNDVIASCAFGFAMDTLDDPENYIYKLGQRAIVQETTQVMKFFGYENLPSLMKFLKVHIISQEDAAKFKHIFKTALNDRRQKLALPRPDFIQTLVDSNETFSDDDLVAQAVLFYIAGFDTTSNLMNYFMYEMAYNPHIQETLQRELDKLPSEHDKDFIEIVQGMEYLDMCVNEVLRLWPLVSSVDRRTTQDYDIGPPKYGGDGKFVVPKNVHVWLPVFSIHRDEKYWPNPRIMDPERFSAENKAKIVPYTYLPFGTGPRQCIGSRFALLAAKIFLVKFFRKYKTRSHLDYGGIHPRAFVLRPPEGFKVIVEPR